MQSWQRGPRLQFENMEDDGNAVWLETMEALVRASNTLQRSEWALHLIMCQGPSHFRTV